MIKKIAIVRLTALGDIVNSSIVLQIIKNNFADVKIDWICEEVFAPILQNHPLLNAVHSINLKSLKKEKNFQSLLHQVRYLRSFDDYDCIIDMQGLLKSAIVARLIGKNIHGYDAPSAREGIASFFYKSKSHIAYSENVVKRNVMLVCEALDIAFNEDAIGSKAKCLASYEKPKFLTQAPYIVFVIGASWPSKVYPKERFSALAKYFQQAIYLVWGNESEKSAAHYIAQNSHAQLTPKLNLQELLSTIEHASLVIGNDTGPTHMAWAQNVPSITLFGPTNERMIYETPINRFVKSDSKVDINKIDKNDLSIQNIDEEEIFAVAKEILGDLSGERDG